MINSEHYPAEKHSVQTKDGYILTVHRIPNVNKPSNNRKVILFMHGEMMINDLFKMLNYSSTDFKFFIVHYIHILNSVAVRFICTIFQFKIKRL